MHRMNKMPEKSGRRFSSGEPPTLDSSMASEWQLLILGAPVGENQFGNLKNGSLLFKLFYSFNG